MKNKFSTFDSFPYQSKKNMIFVDWDEYKTGMEKDIIWTDSVACCLAITLYDPERKKGVLAHISNFSDSPEDLKSEQLIDTLLAELRGKDIINYTRLEATLAGEGLLDINAIKNSPIVKNQLQKYNIPIIGEDLYGSAGRLVFLHCNTGNVEVYRA